MVNVGIIGAGNIAEKMARTIIASPDAHPYGVAARHLDKAKNFADRFGFDNAYGSYEDLCRDPKVDLIYIATPHNFHYPHAKLALTHGKHVLCEKALTINASQAQDLMNIASEKGLTFVEAIWTRYMPLNIKLKDMIQAGVIGKIHAIHSTLAYPIQDKERLKDPHLAGGALLDLGVYPIHFVFSMLGNNYQKMDSQLTKNYLGVDLQTSIILTYPDGAQAYIHCSMSSGPYSHTCILGEKGRFEINGSNHIDQMIHYDNSNQVIKTYQRQDDLGGFEYELAATIELIGAGKVQSNRVTFEDSLAVMQLCDRVRYQHHFYYPEEQ